MKFSDCLRAQLRAYPAMEARDVVKLCYQSVLGGEHLIVDQEAALRYFEKEYEATEPRAEALYEAIGPDAYRVHLGAWKREGLPKEWLWRLFMLSTEEKRLCDPSAAIAAARALLCLEAPALAAELECFLPDYDMAGGGPIHHSDRYRAQYRPAYRVVAGRATALLPILAAMKGKGGVVAMDGPAASGKTTLAKALCRVTGAPCIHMDDFFLPPILRTSERLSEPGGNVHYERFVEEVLPGLVSGEAFRYRKFDCSVMAFGENAEVPAASWRVVEGSYSHHLRFGDYADLRVLLSLAPEEQMARIVARNGERLAKRFQEEWIPMEERYFACFDIAGRADVLL